MWMYKLTEWEEYREDIRFFDTRREALEYAFKRIDAEKVRGFLELGNIVGDDSEQMILTQPEKTIKCGQSQEKTRTFYTTTGIFDDVLEEFVLEYYGSLPAGKDIVPEGGESIELTIYEVVLGAFDY